MNSRSVLFLSFLLIFLATGFYGCKRVTPPREELSPQPLPTQPETVPSALPYTQFPAEAARPESAPATW